MSPVYRSAAGKAKILEDYEKYLQAWPLPYERLRLPTSQGETAVIASGQPDGPAVILLHGSMSNALMWRRDAESWGRHFRLYALDIIGEPGFSAESRPDLHSDALACWLDEVLDALQLQSAIFIGISLGGWLALDYGIRRPDRVDRMVLMCPAGIGRQRQGFFFKVLLLMLLGQWGKDRLRAMITGTDLQDGSEDFRQYLAYLEEIQRHFRPRVVRFQPFSAQALAAVRAPTLVIVGGKDVFFDSRHTRSRLENSTGNFRVLFNEQIGHMITGQTALIEQFLLEFQPG